MTSELYIMLAVCLFWTILYIARKTIIPCLASAILWNIYSAFYLASNPKIPALAFWFNCLGIIFTFYTAKHIIEMKRSKEAW